MKVMILCGGQGTRIRDADWDLPKALVPIRGRPIIWHIMSHYAKYGLKEFILCVGYKAQEIENYFENNKNVHDFKIKYSNAGEAAMTAARIKQAENLLGLDSDFCLTYGDGVSDVNIKNLISYHQAHGKILSITAVNPPSRFGELNLDLENNITAFSEKPLKAERKISGGFFVCKREIFNYLDNSIFEKSPINKLVQDKQVKAFVHEGFWAPMDTYRDFLELNENSYFKDLSPLQRPLQELS